MIVDNLYQADEEYLVMDEVIQRIVHGFRRVTIDRLRGDAIVRRFYADMPKRYRQKISLDSHLSQFDHTAWVSVADTDEPGYSVEFVLRPCHELFIGYENESDRNRLRPSVQRLADLLGYKLADFNYFWSIRIWPEMFDWDDEGDDLYCQLVDAAGQGGSIDEFTFEDGVVRVTAIVPDDDCRDRLVAVIEDMNGAGSFTIELPPDSMPWIA